LTSLRLNLGDGDLPGIENKVRAACVQWAREGGGHEASGKVNPKGSPLIWAILLFLQTLAERNEPPRVVVQEREYVEQRRQTKTTTKKGGKVVVSEESVDKSETYKASLFYTLKELHKYMKKFKGEECLDRVQQDMSATKVKGENAATQAKRVDKLKVHKLRHDSLGRGVAVNVKADFLHNLLRRAEVAAQAERARHAVLAAARQEAINQALVECRDRRTNERPTDDERRRDDRPAASTSRRDDDEKRMLRLTESTRKKTKHRV
jgi:hypothetical protein